MSGRAPKRAAVLGCTGSIGRQTLAVIREFPERFTVTGLSAHTAEAELRRAAAEFSCAHTALTGRDGLESLKSVIERSGADIIVNGIAGAAGLWPSVWALEAGKDLALANKETIVMAGSLIPALAARRGAKLLPVDSEHSALFSLLERLGRDNVTRAVLTASGGPFRETRREDFAKIRAEDALKHPTWRMGKKITVDSATLANKGLEVIEAAYLFGFAPSNISVAVHPQSVVHALAETACGALYAQLSPPDMRRPILDALSYPEASPHNGFTPLRLGETALELSFFPPRLADFPMLPLAYRAAEAGQAACAAYNAANEIAAEAFLRGAIRFTDFEAAVSPVVSALSGKRAGSFDEIFAVDAEARSEARRLIADIGGRA